MLAECEKFGNAVGTKDRDIMSNYIALEDLELTLNSFQSKNLKSYQQEEKSDDSLPAKKATRCPINELMKSLEFDNDAVVRFGNNGWYEDFICPITGFKAKTKSYHRYQRFTLL